MGMFDKDKEMGLILTDWIDSRQEFVLHNARIVREDFPTSIGPATQTELEVSRMGEGDRYRVTTLASAIAEKVKEADPSDFPAVVWWMQVQSSRFPDRQATVLQFVRPL